MDFVDCLNKTQEIVALILVAIPAIGTPVYSVLAKLGKTRTIIKALLEAMKDKELTDLEVATFAWMLISVLSGLWPNHSLDVLRLAPDHQIRELAKKEFITREQETILLAKGA